MADVILLPDGSRQIISGMQDIVALVDAYLGYEARTELEELLSEQDLDAGYIDDLEAELKIWVAGLGAEPLVYTFSKDADVYRVQALLAECVGK